MSARVRLRAFSALLSGPRARVLLVASLVGWGAMTWLTLRSAHAGHTAHGGQGSPSPGLDAMPSHSLWIWAAMVLAMAPLVLLREIGLVWQGSLRRQRFPALVLFLAGYGLVWTVLGVAAVPLAELLTGRTWLGWLALGVVVGWHCSPPRQWCLNLCHRAPVLRAFGSGALADAFRYGLRAGAMCAAVCGPAMVLVLLAADHHLVAMLGATAVLTVERYLPARRPRWRLPLGRVTSPEWPGLGAGARPVRIS